MLMVTTWLMLITIGEACEEQDGAEGMVVTPFISFRYDRSFHCQITAIFKLTFIFKQCSKTWKHAASAGFAAIYSSQVV